MLTYAQRIQVGDWHHSLVCSHTFEWKLIKGADFIDIGIAKTGVCALGQQRLRAPVRLAEKYRVASESFRQTENVGITWQRRCRLHFRYVQAIRIFCLLIGIFRQNVDAKRFKFRLSLCTLAMAFA